jgi:hypothetical protein
VDGVGIARDEGWILDAPGERRAQGKMIEQPEQHALIAQQRRGVARNREGLVEVPRAVNAAQRTPSPKARTSE